MFSQHRCVGQAASMGSLLLASGAPGLRHSLPNARIMIHQVSGGAQVCSNISPDPFFFIDNIIHSFIGSSNGY